MKSILRANLTGVRTPVRFARSIRTVPLPSAGPARVRQDADGISALAPKGEGTAVYCCGVTGSSGSAGAGAAGAGAGAGAGGVTALGWAGAGATYSFSAYEPG
jgi:alpha-galactosidase